MDFLLQLVKRWFIFTVQRVGQSGLKCSEEGENCSIRGKSHGHSVLQDKTIAAEYCAVLLEQL